jgi:hypothetical protein
MYREGLKGGILLRPGVTPGDLGKIHVNLTAPAATLSFRPRIRPRGRALCRAICQLYFPPNYLPITSTTNVSASTSLCVDPWPCLAVTVITLCVFVSNVAVRAPDCVSISSSTLNLSGESS